MKKDMMIPRKSLAALLSSIVSQLSLLLLLFLRHPPFSSSVGPTLLPLLLHHFHATIGAAALVSRKRKPSSDPPGPNSDSDTDSDSSDDAHIAIINPRLAELGRVDPRLAFDPSSFRAHFNMSPSTFEWLSDLLEPLLDCRDPIGSPLNLSPELRLGIGIYRLSTGSDYPEIARIFRVTEPVAKFCSRHLCRVLCTNFRFWVGFPNPAELKTVSDGFQSLTGLPNCCGVIGCARFKIQTVCGGHQTIASQIVVDSNSRILSIVAGCTGDQGNLTILKSSSLFKDIESRLLMNSPPIEVNGVSVPQYIVGESGYPLLPWLMVPAPDSALSEQNFNSAIHLLQEPLSKTVASLRNWGVLRRPIEGEQRNAVAYLGSCAILHNALLIREDFSSLCSEIRADDTGLDYDHGLGCLGDEIIVEESSEIKARLIRSTLAKLANQPTTQIE